MKILVTGGAGYIGSHTIVDLIENNFDVVSIDNFSNSDDQLLKGIEQITGTTVVNYNVDLCDLEKVKEVFSKNKIDAIIHFAAFKSVDESVGNPFKYYQNNIQSLNNILKMVEEYKIKHFVFSSSCSVYGNCNELPVTEKTSMQYAQSAYGATKQMGERMIEDFQKICAANFIMLRYFNPTGAHPSNLIGEIVKGKPSGLVPNITQAAAGIIPFMTVFGTDYDTRDGSCIRDFIHVSDIAHAHTLALQKSLADNSQQLLEIYNLGTGNGITVIETIASFEKVTGKQFSYNKGPRRDGDVVAVYADNSKAKSDLHWHCQYSLDDMLQTAWAWQEKISAKL